MFSRRHPYLFFLLIFSGIMATMFIILPSIIIFGTKNFHITDSIKSSGEKVGIIELKGAITDSKQFIADLKKFREDTAIKAVIVRIDSPGGGVAPSQEIYNEIRKTIRIKHIITSMGSLAASGGYYVAAATEGIVANPGTITGSIGVIMGFTNFEEIIKKIGLLPIVVKSREFKDIGSPLRKMTDKEKQLLQNFVNRIHAQFVKAIVEGRKMNKTKIEEIADGRIFSGEEAKELGLVDKLGNLEDAVKWAGDIAGIKGKIDTVYAQEKKFSFLEYVMESSLNAIIQKYLCLLYPYV